MPGSSSATYTPTISGDDVLGAAHRQPGDGETRGRAQQFFWVIGAFSLFAAALGIVDYTSRLAADVIKTSYAPRAAESRIYFGLVWPAAVRRLTTRALAVT